MCTGFGWGGWGLPWLMFLMPLLMLFFMCLACRIFRPRFAHRRCFPPLAAGPLEEEIRLLRREVSELREEMKNTPRPNG